MNSIPILTVLWAQVGDLPAAFWIAYTAIIILQFAGLWGCFAKAGKPGWAAIIPIYNIVVMLEIAEKELWWLILFFIPCVNIVISILVYIDFAKAYGQSGAFAVGLILLPFIFFPILGFGSAQYVGLHGGRPHDTYGPTHGAYGPPPGQGPPSGDNPYNPYG